MRSSRAKASDSISDAPSPKTPIKSHQFDSCAGSQHRICAASNQHNTAAFFFHLVPVKGHVPKL